VLFGPVSFAVRFAAAAKSASILIYATQQYSVVFLASRRRARESYAGRQNAVTQRSLDPTAIIQFVPVQLSRAGER